MKRISLLFAIPVMALIMACGSGNGGGGETNGDGNGVAETPAGGVVVIEVAVDDNGFISEVPIDVEGGELYRINFNAGTTYEIHFTNNAVRLRVLLIFRWGVEAIAQTGATTISNTFTPEVPGEYQCHEKLLGGTDARFKCLAVVS